MGINDYGQTPSEPLATPALYLWAAAVAAALDNDDTTVDTRLIGKANNNGTNAAGTWPIDIIGNASSADTVPASVYALPAPPDEGYVSGSFDITATSWADAPGQSPITFTNNTGRTVLCLVSATTWMQLDESVNGAGYVDVTTDGAAWSRRLSTSRVNTKSAYEDTMALHVAAVAPGGTLTARMRAWRSANQSSCSIQYSTTAIVPIGWGE